MNIKDLTKLILTPEENQELENTLALLDQKDYTIFYATNSEIIRNILFVESLDEFLDFSNESDLGSECFGIAYVCQKQYGIQIGGYEDDVRPALTAFFQLKGILSPTLRAAIEKEKIYTDCSSFDNFKVSIVTLNQILDTLGVQLLVFKDFVYCDCEYSVLLLKKDLCHELSQSWESENFEIYLISKLVDSI